MNYRDGDVVVTADGRKHRVLWPTKRDGSELFVKSLDDKHKKAYKLRTDKITGHKPKGTK